jgi:hypothetical protein
MKILAPAEGLIDKAIRLATEATNIASSEAEVHLGYMTDQASINKALEEIGDAIQVIQAHPTPGALIVVECMRSGFSDKDYLAISASADSKRHIQLSPLEDPTTNGSPISQLLKSLSLLKKDVLALPSSRDLTEEEKGLLSKIWCKSEE